METNSNYVYLYGAGGHSHVILDILEANDKCVKAFIDDSLHAHSFDGIPIMSSCEDMTPMIISIGDNKTRRRIAEKLQNRGKTRFDTAIYPSNIISKRVAIGEGTVVMQGVIIQSGVRIGKHCIINTASSVDHDCEIENYVHISPHATLCGCVKVGEGSWIGADTVVRQGIKIGKWCVVGAGSVVIKDLPDGVVAYGIPCKVHSINYEKSL